MPKKNFVWVREDFRMEDNPALYSISNFRQKIYAFFIYDEKKFKNRSRSEERRVGKECRSRMSLIHFNTKYRTMKMKVCNNIYLHMNADR